MRVRTPGQILENFWFLGNEESCVYLLEGKSESILINGGTSVILPEVIEQLRKFRIDESKIKAFLILHSHFDHVGIVPFFKRIHPDIKVYASRRSGEVLNKTKAINAINSASRYIIDKRDLQGIIDEYDPEWQVGMQISPLQEGDCIDLGEMEVRIFETPGHSPCSISAYCPQLKALFPSDAGGVPFEEGVNAYGISDYTVFEDSLNKLKSFDVEYLGADHCGYVTGKEAGSYIAEAIEVATHRRKLMHETYTETGDLDRASRKLAAQFKDENIGNIVPHDTFVESFRQMIIHIAGLRSK